MIFRVHTSSGSEYEIDTERKYWERLSGTSTGLRTEEGVFRTVSEPELGRPLIITAEPLDPAAVIRVITTSPVMMTERRQ